MILNQKELMEASQRFSASYYRKPDSTNTDKNIIYIMYSTEDLRLVEGLAVTITEIIGRINLSWQ